MKNRDLFLMAIVLLAVVLYKFVFSSKNNDGFLNDVEGREIKSIVIKKYINHDNHGIPFIIYRKMDNQTDSLIVYEDWWNKISIGDSILKPKESLELVIKKSEKIEKFNYKDKFGL